MTHDNKSGVYEKWRRFRRNPRAMISLILLVALYLVSLAAEFVCSSKPLYLLVNGRSFFPFVSYVPESAIFGGTAAAEPDYTKIEADFRFTSNQANRVIFAPFRCGPRDIVSPEAFERFRRLRVTVKPEARVGRCDIDSGLAVVRQDGCEPFFATSSESVDNEIFSAIHGSAMLVAAISNRLANIASPAESVQINSVEYSLIAFKPRENPPRTVRIRLRDSEYMVVKPFTIRFDRLSDGTVHPVRGASAAVWRTLSDEVRRGILSFDYSDAPAESVRLDAFGGASATAVLEQVAWPHRPVPGHPMGIDNAGRDVLARVLFGMRTAMSFGVLLVIWSMLIGIAAGAVQGYFGGWIDLVSQRFIEIWSALPFLYVMILIGSVFGRSFGLLLFCYGLFNWIGVSYYVRAEFYRLRKRPFVEAAKCQGLSSWRIIVRHILPNALTPVITLIPFNLVGAIASISALDFLGFGLPPLTPSWGELLQQAQQNTSAWWLILYPSFMLFSVMLLTVFIGEGLRDAFDPKPSSRYR